MMRRNIELVSRFLALAPELKAACESAASDRKRFVAAMTKSARIDRSLLREFAIQNGAIVKTKAKQSGHWIQWWRRHSLQNLRKRRLNQARLAIAESLRAAKEVK
jgi:hypothetical protein